jgi:hypothetical protein
MKRVTMLVVFAAAVAGQTREITMPVLRDKVAGGWAGQMIGVSFGAPTEFRWLEKIIEGPLPEWTPDKVRNALNQDDLYVDMTFAKVLDDKGLNATTEDFGAMFRDARYALWHANLAARRALKRGVPATRSGTPEFNAHANDIDFQIEADFVGLMAPGLPRAANEICYRAGRVMNHGDGIYGGMFVSGMYAAAFFESDPFRIVEAGLRTIPAKSPYAQTIADTLAWSRQFPGDWRKVWRLIEDKWNKREPCPNGALHPFNIDARLNGAYIALGLLHGKGDFWQTLEISTRAGQDSDCNPASACGILGVVMGYRAIPEKWKGGIPAIANEKFRYTDLTFETIIDSTVKRAVALVEQNGGRREGDRLIVKTQTPKPWKLDIWDDYGSPVERIAHTDSRWRFTGDWTTKGDERITAAKGAEAAIAFEGTGGMIVGSYLPTGGKADIYLDGKLHRTVDVYPDENSPKRMESVWHAFNLKPGRHEVRLVVRGETYGESNGADISIHDFVVFR